MEFISHIWSDFTHTVFLDKLGSRDFCFVDYPEVNFNFVNLKKDKQNLFVSVTKNDYET